MLPRTIWCLWFQGWAAAPDIVRACARSWRTLNPTWQVRCLDRSMLAHLIEMDEIDAAFASGTPPEAIANLVRLELLNRHGGVWVDATAYCLRPLDEWIHSAAASGFFAFDRPGPDRMLSSWFLASKPQSYIVAEWQRRARDYWQGRIERHTYFWCHGLFGEAYHEDETFRRLWDAVPKLSANGPHYYEPYGDKLHGQPSTTDRLIVETAQTPLLKLTHKIDHAACGPDSVYRWLCERTQSRRMLFWRRLYIRAARLRPPWVPTLRHIPLIEKWRYRLDLNA